jgi:uncharacterized CHY-type Zn-finger protein
MRDPVSHNRDKLNPLQVVGVYAHVENMIGSALRVPEICDRMEVAHRSLEAGQPAVEGGSSHGLGSMPEGLMQRAIHGMQVHGVTLDGHTRCAHWHSPLDIVAIKMRCCQTYYACSACHQAEADHPVEVWPRSEFDAKALLCGACGEELTIAQYLQCGAVCPTCQASFNPGCQRHHHLYFAT